MTTDRTSRSGTESRDWFREHTSVLSGGFDVDAPLDDLEPLRDIIGDAQVAAHNNHIQKTPVYFDGELATLPMGHYLDRVLGESYRALAQTHTAEHVVEMYPDERTGSGLTTAEEPLDASEPGSVEAAVIESGHGADISLTDLRGLGGEALDRIRTQSSSLLTPV
ncbi:erythromycin esterase family protein [Actinopolyspora saharensis]|uniref:erythromycin esterase family protein n=1 Tax=Actinopolyspora saharensis TaxID=995062 RepID=UPI003F676CD2